MPTSSVTVRGMKGRTPGIIGERLKDARERMGLTQDQLAAQAGVHRLTVVKLESGARDTAGSDNLARLADALGVSVDYLLGRMERSSIEPFVVEYLASPWAAIDAPTQTELEELRRIEPAFWRGKRPSPEILHEILRVQRKITAAPKG